MALKTPMSTPGDVRNLREEIYSSVRDDARLLAHIFRADAKIRSMLDGYYTIDDDLLDTAAWNGPPQVRLQMGDVAANSGDVTLLDVTPGATARTELWTITFSDATNFSVSSTLGGSQGTGDTGNLFTSTDSRLLIPAANWGGTAAVAGDQIFVATYAYRPLIVLLSAQLAAYYASSDIFRGQQGLPPEVLALKEEFDEMMAKLMSPYDDDGIRLGSFAERDISPEGVQYWIGIDGRDYSNYADNEQTSWNEDTTQYSFLYGPIWWGR